MLIDVKLSFKKYVEMLYAMRLNILNVGTIEIIYHIHICIFFEAFMQNLKFKIFKIVDSIAILVKVVVMNY